MVYGFWKSLRKPIMALAPMADVTDPPFRQIIAKYSKYGGQDIFGEEGKFTRPGKAIGGPDVMFTEFVSCDGLCSAGKVRILKDIVYTEAERPIVLQIFGAKPENFYACANLAQELGFDGIDINMGCPDKTIEKQGAGAALIKNPKLAIEIIQRTKDGAGKLPVSVKTRLGFNKDELEEWLPALLDSGLVAVTIHARTRKEMSKAPARWERVARAVEIRNERKSETLILGNGDVCDLEDARFKIRVARCDGAMLGRAIFGNPWLFSNLASTKCYCQIENPPQTLPKENPQNEIRKINYDIGNGAQGRNRPNPPTGGECAPSILLCNVCGGYIIPISERLRVLVEHTHLYEKLMGGVKSFAIMKKHYKAYVNGFDGAKELRMKLMEAKCAEDVER